MIKYTEEMRERIARDAVGKTVGSLEYEDGDVDSGPYWVMVFTDGTEIAFRFMAELTP